MHMQVLPLAICSQSYPQARLLELAFGSMLGATAGKDIDMTLTAVAEMYLGMLTPQSPQARLYVRLAAKYGVPFGRIVNLSGLPAEVVAAYLEGKD